MHLPQEGKLREEEPSVPGEVSFFLAQTLLFLLGVPGLLFLFSTVISGGWGGVLALVVLLSQSLWWTVALAASTGCALGFVWLSARRH